MYAFYKGAVTAANLISKVTIGDIIGSGSPSGLAVIDTIITVPSIVC